MLVHEDGDVGTTQQNKNAISWKTGRPKHIIEPQNGSAWTTYVQNEDGQNPDVTTVNKMKMQHNNMQDQANKMEK